MQRKLIVKYLIFTLEFKDSWLSKLAKPKIIKNIGVYKYLSAAKQYVGERIWEKGKQLKKNNQTISVIR